MHSIFLDFIFLISSFLSSNDLYGAARREVISLCHLFRKAGIRIEYVMQLPKRISKGRLLQLHIQALQVTACGYKNSSSKLIMAKNLKWDMLQFCTLIFQYDIHRNVFVALLRIFYQILISYCKFSMPKALKWGMLCLCTLIFQFDIHKTL